MARQLMKQARKSNKKCYKMISAWELRAYVIIILFVKLYQLYKEGKFKKLFGKPNK